MVFLVDAVVMKDVYCDVGDDDDDGLCSLLS